MARNPHPAAVLPVAYHLLRVWMRQAAYLVPEADRVRWRAEWDGELWFGVAARVPAPQTRTVFALALGIFRDALELRRIGRSRSWLRRRRGDGLMSPPLGQNGLGTRGRQTLRRLLAEWRYSAGVILILGIGIGPAAVGLTVVDKVLLQPLAFEEPDRIGVVRIDVGDLENHPGLDPNEIQDLRETEGVFKAVEHVFLAPVWIEVGDELVPVSGAASVSPGLFEMLGVFPVMGRSFGPDDLSWGEGQSRAIILSHDIWRTSFGEDLEILGRSIHIQGRPHEVVGVLPPDFRLQLDSGSDIPPVIDLWRPDHHDRGYDGGAFRRFWNTLVRLEDGVSFEQANASLAAFTEQERQRYPEAYDSSRLWFSVSPLLADMVRETKPAIMAAFVGVLLLLVTAIVNASVLVVVAQRRRTQELAVRTAIGAARRSLLAEVLLECVLMGAASCVLGAGLAAMGVAGVRAVIPHDVPRLENLVLGWEAVVLPAFLASVVVTSVAVTAVWGLVRGNPWKSLVSGSDRTRTPRSVSQSILVGSQVVMAVVLLFGAVQLLRSTRELARTDLGFDPESTIALEVPLFGTGLSHEEQYARYLQIRDRLEELLGVVSVGAISNPPLHSLGTISTLSPEGTPVGADDSKLTANFFSVIPGYFDSVDNLLLQGRDFLDTESSVGIPVAVIDETLARMAFPGQDPIGKTIHVDVLGDLDLPDPRIVGVVAHSRLIDPTRDVRPQVYLPFSVWQNHPLYLTVRTEGPPQSVLPAARDVVRELGTGAPILQVQLLSENLGMATSVLRAVTILVVVLALSAAFLAALGLYAVVSYIVIQQRRATTIRCVLGASPGNLLLMQLKRVGLILLAAVPAGVIVSLLGARLLESLVYGVAVRDVGSLVAATILGALTGLLAAYLPAWRGAKADLRMALEAD